MTRRFLVPALCVAASFLGGLAGSRWLPSVLPADARPGEAQEKIVIADRLEIRDKKGKARFVLCKNAEDAPVFGFYDGEGRSRAEFGLAKDGSPGLRLADDQGRTRAWLGIEGGPTLRLFGEDGTAQTSVDASHLRFGAADKPLLSLGTDKGGVAGIRLADAAGQARLWLWVDAKGAPNLQLLAPDGKPRALLSSDPEGNPSLGLKDKTGRLRAALMITPQELPFFGFLDSRGNKRLEMALNAEGTSGLYLFDAAARQRLQAFAAAEGPAGTGILTEEGTVVWSAP